LAVAPPCSSKLADDLINSFADLFTEFGVALAARCAAPEP
jgi:hypothetical protein